MSWETKLAEATVVELTPDELVELLTAADIVLEEDTKISGPIRVLSIDGATVVQEQTPKRVLLARSMRSVDDARQLVAERLETYDRMWDGCGCKVDYFS